jgi:hypothetical protein
MSVVKVDFTGVEVNVRAEEGEHICVAKSMEDKKASTGSDMIATTFEVVAGSSTGAKLYENFVLLPQSLFKLKAYREAVGLKSEGRLKINTDDMLNKKFIAVVEHKKKDDGTIRAEIVAYKKLSAPAEKAKPGAKDAPAEKDDEEDWDEA